jgi:hypothetical protein
MPIAKATIFSPNSENSTTSMKTALRIPLTPTTGASHDGTDTETCRTLYIQCRREDGFFCKDAKEEDADM